VQELADDFAILDSDEFALGMHNHFFQTLNQYPNHDLFWGCRGALQPLPVSRYFANRPAVNPSTVPLVSNNPAGIQVRYVMPEIRKLLKLIFPKKQDVRTTALAVARTSPINYIMRVILQPRVSKLDVMYHVGVVGCSAWLRRRELKRAARLALNLTRTYRAIRKYEPTTQILLIEQEFYVDQLTQRLYPKHAASPQTEYSSALLQHTRLGFHHGNIPVHQQGERANFARRKLLISVAANPRRSTRPRY
jgi:hypothetical protein